VIIAGHTHCGGAAAALKIASSQPGEQTSDTALSRWLTPLIGLAKALLVKQPQADVRALVEENVKQQVHPNFLLGSGR
jgi:carbonic anhydrase